MRAKRSDPVIAPATGYFAPLRPARRSAPCCADTQPEVRADRGAAGRCEMSGVTDSERPWPVGRRRDRRRRRASRLVARRRRRLARPRPTSSGRAAGAAPPPATAAVRRRGRPGCRAGDGRRVDGAAPIVDAELVEADDDRRPRCRPGARPRGSDGRRSTVEPSGRGRRSRPPSRPAGRRAAPRATAVRRPRPGPVPRHRRCRRRRRRARPARPPSAPMLAPVPVPAAAAEPAAGAVHAGPADPAPSAGPGCRGRPAPPRAPAGRPHAAPALAGAIPALVRAGAWSAAFFGWVSAEPFWLAVGHGHAGTATVVAECRPAAGPTLRRRRRRVHGVHGGPVRCGPGRPARSARRCRPGWSRPTPSRAYAVDQPRPGRCASGVGFGLVLLCGAADRLGHRARDRLPGLAPGRLDRGAACSAPAAVAAAMLATHATRAAMLALTY